ncbi:Hsp70 protein [Glycomyces sambucus]|uniref:Hsp70 protein n=2 Tax=Glycomyces sambucus TaxID=380244 RepID=A0A1G9M5X7_9ACTN|nr:Hsp70 protein [Glycomyces sambucus]
MFVRFVTILVMSPGPQGTALGVDFGTSHTIAVVRRADGSVRPLLFDGAPLMPSAVCADADGGLLVGRDAVHAGRRHPERFEPNPKRLIDRPSTLLGEREFPVPDLIAAVLGAVAAESRRVVGAAAQVTLTVPAEWGPARRRVVEDAASRAGLGRVRLVPEPVAAATYYAEALKHRTAVGSSIVVYDLGAGTFDASVVRRTESGFETVALDGRGDLGGLDIDAALIEHLGGVYGDREGWKRLVGPETIEERRYFREFQEEVRGAKERLSRHQQSDIAIPLLDVEAHLTRHELEQIARPHLEQTVRVTLGVIRAAGLSLGEAPVFLVGGASRMPLVATMLHRELGTAPTVLDQPEVVVAEGSVLWARSDAATLHLQRPAPAAAPAPATTPQAAPVFAPRQPTAYRPQESPASPHRALPPVATPPAAPPVSVSGDAPEPPETDAERLRRKKIGRRLLAGFIAVDLLIVAGLWWFNRDEGATDEFDDLATATSFTPDWEPAEAGTNIAQIESAHADAVMALAPAETADGPMLFSRGNDGMLRQWNLETGALVDEFDLEIGVQALWAAASSTGYDHMVAIGDDGDPYLWTAETGEFTWAGTPEMVAEGAEVRIRRTGVVDGHAVLSLLNETEYELYDLESQETVTRLPVPSGYGYPRFFTSTDGPATNLVAVTGAQQVDVVDGATGEPWGLAMTAGDQPLSTAAFAVVYYWDTPYAMLYDAGGDLYFWDLDAQTPALEPVPYGDEDDSIHHELVDTSGGMSLLCLDTSGAAKAVGIGHDEEIEFPSGGAEVTKLVDVTVDGTQYAATGDSNGNIRFWSLGL